MTTAIADIYNRALSAVGSSAVVTLITEDSNEAQVCSLWYETARDLVLRAAPWPTCRGYRRLAQLSEHDATTDWTESSPPPGWRFAFAAPSDMIWPYHLHNLGRFTPAIDDNNRKIIATNVEKPILHYTRRIEDPSVWEVDLRSAVEWTLAAFIAGAITGKDSVFQRCAGQAARMIVQAQLAAANSFEDQLDTLPEWIQARDSVYGAREERFVYPSAEFIISQGIPANAN